MSNDRTIQRRSVLFGAAAVAATGLVGGVRPAAAEESSSSLAPSPLWRWATTAGSSSGAAWSTRLSSDRAYSAAHQPRRVHPVQRGRPALVQAQAHTLTPSWTSPTATGSMHHAERDEPARAGLPPGLGRGLRARLDARGPLGLNRRQARDLLYGVVKAEVKHYHGQTSAWIVANEVTDPEGVNGFRTNVPWYNTIGPDYVARPSTSPTTHDPHAELILNEFGFETVNQYGDEPGPAPKALLEVLDTLLGSTASRCTRSASRPTCWRPTSPTGSIRSVPQVPHGDRRPRTPCPDHRDGRPRRRTARGPRIRDRAVADVYKRYLEVSPRRDSGQSLAHLRPVRPLHLAAGGLPPARRCPPSPAAVRRPSAPKARLLGAAKRDGGGSRPPAAVEAASRLKPGVGRGLDRPAVARNSAERPASDEGAALIGSA